MSAELCLVDRGGDALEFPIEFGEWEQLEGDAGHGEVKEIQIVNTGTTRLRDITLELSGAGASSMSLAIAQDSGHGVWAAPGEGILIERTLLPGQRVSFWARAIFAPEDPEGFYPFDLRITALSMENERDT